MNVRRIVRALALVAVAFAAGCASVTSGHAGIANERIGVCSWSWLKPMSGVAEDMEAAGVKGIHLALGPFISPDGRHGGAEGEEALAFVKAKIAKGEWNVMSTMIGMVGEDYSTLETIRATGGIVPDGTWETNRRIVTRGARLTQELGCHYMSTHAGFLDESNAQALSKFIERVRWMRDECRKYDVELILESGQETADDLYRFLDLVPGVGINFDPANMVLYDKGRPMDALKLLYPRIRQVHVKDAFRTKVPGTWGEEVPWGEGEVGGRKFVAALEALGYKGNYVVEREAGSDRARDIRKAIKILEN
ncbi:MAG: sugar phosphate isomerase/epimerase [Kiritimatiellae bacterium]|nr:sugar phosphate isomerase/epimerase [Kiritimatiellia bacterium]